MTKPILVLNCGSSSIKYQMIDVETESVMAKGLVERIGADGNGAIKHSVDGKDFTSQLPLPDHVVALREVVGLFSEHGPDLAECLAVGHRTVHGGTKFMETTLITDDVVTKMQDLIGLAPLHNPAVIAGIKAARQALPGVPHVAIFDTAFFSSLPDEAAFYAIDTEVAHKYQIRKYGFHGTSHKFVSAEAAKFLGKDLNQIRQIVCHLGNGASMSAIDCGRPIETSMGLTPLAGLVMGTRCGDVDPGLIFYLSREAGMSINEIDQLLNKESGMSGLCGFIDMRDVDTAINEGNEKAILARKIYVHRLVSYIGSYYALLGGVDVISFTAGVGENDPAVRKETCEALSCFGVKIDEEANKVRGPQPRVISTPDSKIQVLVVPTNEELSMAREVARIIGE